MHTFVQASPGFAAYSAHQGNLHSMKVTTEPSASVNLSYPLSIRLLLATSMLASCAPPPVQANNLAAGRPMVYSPAPNYRLTTSPDDPMKLTDGQIAPTTMWHSKLTVGWSNVTPVFLSIDLGIPQEIDSLDMTSAGGEAGVKLPRGIEAYGSNDNQNWERLGGLSLPPGTQTPTSYQRVLYTLSNIAKTCRYVRFAVASAGDYYFFTDEIHVFGAASGSHPIQPTITDVAKDLPLALAKHLSRTRVAGQIASLGSIGEQFKASHPNHLANPNPLWAQIAHAKGFGDFKLWKKDRMAPLGIHDFPGSNEQAAKVSVRLFKGEKRGDAFLISNSLETPSTIRIKAGSSASEPRFLRIAACPWTATFGGQEISDALPYQAAQNGEWTFEVEPGSTTRVWVEVDGSLVPIGKTNLQLSVSTKSATIGTVPVAISVSPVDIGTPTMALGSFDYIDVFGKERGLLPISETEFWNMVKDIPITVDWLHPTSLPTPKAEQFAGATVNGLDFARIDRWIGLTPGLKYRMFFLNARENFAGAAMGSPEFSQKVGAWAKAVGNHVHAKDPNCKFGVLLVDEPSTTKQAEIITSWATAIKAATNEVLIYEDPFFTNLSDPAIKTALGLCDMLCLNQTYIMKRYPDLISQYVQAASGKELWLYDTVPDPKELDPTDYYRLFAWRAFANQAKGIVYWSFTDVGPNQDAWAEDASIRHSYSPLYLGSHLATSLHWEAIRDGLWDVQLFKTLATRSRHTTLENDANAILAEVNDLANGRSGASPWQDETDSQKAEALRVRATALLERLK